MKFIRTIFVCLIILSLVTIFVACKKDKDSEGSGDATTTTIVAGNSDNNGVGTGDGDATANTTDVTDKLLGVGEDTDTTKWGPMHPVS